MADVLKSYLISYGFAIDAPSRKKVEDGVKVSEETQTRQVQTEAERRAKIEAREAAEREKARDLGAKKEQERRDATLRGIQSVLTKASAVAVKTVAAVEATALGVVYATDRAAKSFEKLNYMTQRTGASATGAGAFGYASSQLGSSAAEAEGGLEAFGKSLRTNGQGYGNALSRIGVNARDAKGQLRDTADIATDLGDALRRIQEQGGRFGYARSMAYAQQFGFGENQARAMMDPGFRARQEQYKADQKRIGANPEEAAKAATAFEQSMRHLQEVLEAVGTKISTVLFTKLKPLLDDLSAWFLANGDRVTDIIVKLADDLISLAKSIGEHLASADWDKIIANVKGFADGLSSLLSKLGGEGGLVALLGLVALRLSGLARLVLPPWLIAVLGIAGGAKILGDNAKGIFDQGFNAVTPGATTPDIEKNQSMGVWDRAKRIWRSVTGQGNSDFSDEKGSGPSRDVDTAKNPRLATSRASFFEELDRDPALMRDVIKTASEENNGSPEKMTTVIESMVNRSQMNGYTSLRQAIHSGFYGPVNSGALNTPLSAKDRADGDAAIRAVRTGSNLIGYRTDQGMRTDKGARRYLRQGGDHSGWAVIHGENFFYMDEKGREWARRQRELDKLPLKTPPMLKAPGTEKMSMIAPTPVQREHLASIARRSVRVDHAPTFHMDGGSRTQLASVDLPAGRGSRDMIRNLQGAEA